MWRGTLSNGSVYARTPVPVRQLDRPMGACILGLMANHERRAKVRYLYSTAFDLSIGVKGAIVGSVAS